MINLRIPLSLFILAVIFIAPAFASEVESILPGEIKFGEKGYGLTVLQGNKIIRFPVEFIGVVENVMVDQDLAMIRLEGEPFDKTGVIAGMSGSPIYFRGRLLGALAYGWGFSKEPIAGVTPIALMEKLITEQERIVSPPAGFIPLAAPLSVAGLPIDGADEAWAKVEDLGFLAAPGGRVKTKQPPLQPGSAIGVRLIDGDLSLTAIGTVTMVRDSNVVAFGHPFVNRGASYLPMTGAEVVAIMPVQSISFKMSSATDDVGAMIRDGQPGIAGRIGKSPEMIPMAVNLSTPWSATSYSYLIARDEFFSPQLFNIAWAASAGAGLFSRGPAGVEVMIAITVDSRTVELRDRGVVENSVLEVMPTLPVSSLYRNPFRMKHPDSVTIEVNVTENLARKEILDVVPLQAVISPGETLALNVRFRTYNEGKESRRVEIQIPERAEEGPLFITVSGGRGLARTNLATPDKFEDILDLLSAYEPQNRLVVRGTTKQSKQYEVEGGLLPDLPPSLRGVQRGKSRGPIGFEKVYEMTEPVTGASIVQVEVKKRPTTK